MKPLTDAEHSKARSIRLQQQINNTNKIIQNRKNNENKPNKTLETPLIQFSKADILKKKNRFNTLNAQMSVSNKLMKAGEDLEAGIIPQLADPRSTSEKLRDLQLQTQTCISNCKLLLSDNEQANELFTYLMGDQNMMMFFNYSFPDIKAYFDKKKNTLARTAILYIEQLQYVHQRTGGVDNPLQQQDYAQGVNQTMNAVFQTGLAGIQATRDMHNDNINNLNNAGTMLVNEMRNNIVPQITMLNDLRNELIVLNVNNTQEKADLMNKLDALIAVVDQDNTPEMQNAFEQAYANLNLPNSDDINAIVGEMNDNTQLIADKLDRLGGLLGSITIQNLEKVLFAGKGEKAGDEKAVSKKGKPEKLGKQEKPSKNSLDDFISRAFSADTFNNDVDKINQFAEAYGRETKTKTGKQRSLDAIAGDIYTNVIKYFKIIRKQELTGNTDYKDFSDGDVLALQSIFGDLKNADSQEELTKFYVDTQARLEQLMLHKGASTLDNMKGSTFYEPAGAAASTPPEVDIKQEGNGLKKKRKNKKKVVKKQKVKRKTRYIE